MKVFKNDFEGFKRAAKNLNGTFYIDFETNGVDYGAKIYGVSILIENEVYLFLQSPEMNREVLNLLNGKKIGAFNSTGLELPLLEREGVRCELVADPFFMLSILQKPNMSLKDFAQATFKLPEDGVIRLEDVAPQKDFSNVSTDSPKVWEYMMQDVILLRDCDLYLMQNYPQYRQIYELDLKVAPILARETAIGMRVNPDPLPEKIKEIEVELENMKSELIEVFGDINFGSPAQVSKAIVTRLGVELPKTPTGRYSAAMDVLKDIDHPNIQTLIRYRSLLDLMSDIKNFPKFVASDGRLHPGFRLHAPSGASRIYATNPSVTSIPLSLREVVVPDEGKKFVYIDWHAAEFLTFAYLSGQEDVLQANREGKDLIQWAAEGFNGYNLDRDGMKVVIYSTLYGSEGHTIQERFKISMEEAKNVLNSYWRRFPKMAEYKDKLIEKSSQTGMVKTIYGRPRRIPEIFSKDAAEQKKGFRKVVNTAIQSSVGDLLRKALVDVLPLLREEERVVLQVFDSFLFEIPVETSCEEFLERVAPALRTEVGFRFSVGEGATWKDAQLNIIKERA